MSQAMTLLQSFYLRYVVNYTEGLGFKEKNWMQKSSHKLAAG